jgi:hypothetical protein
LRLCPKIENWSRYVPLYNFLLVWKNWFYIIQEKFMYENKILDCVVNFKYLGLYFSASGSFSFAQNELHKKALKAYYKLHKDLLTLNPNINTSLHVFDYTIKPILITVWM